MIGSIVRYLLAPDDPEAVHREMADAATRIVSLTVTEGGYNFHPVTGEFDADNPAVRPTWCQAPCPRRRSGSSPRRSTGGGSAASRRSRSCPATTSRATATSPTRCSPRSPGCGTRELARAGWRAGAVPQLHGRPDHPGHHRRGPRGARPSGSGSRTGGRWCASRSRSGRWRTSSVTAGRRWRTPACRSCRTSSRTS